LNVAGPGHVPDRARPAAIDRYAIVRELGAGAMGRVYKGWDADLQCWVAIKVVDDRLREDATARAIFQRELRTLGQLRHPNIARAMAAGEHEGARFLVMEYVHGVDLGRLIEYGAIEFRVALLMLLDLARALEAAHGRPQPIVHRDLKPSNVMLARDGSCQLMDFGLSRRLSEDDQVSMRGGLVGTIAYMSPEQTEMREPGCPSDVFSLGILAYRMFSGRPPFGDARDGVPAYVQRVRHEAPEPIAPAIPEGSPALAALLHAMLHKQPESRPTAARVVLELLHEVRRLDLGEGRTLLREFAMQVVPADTDEPPASVLSTQQTLASVPAAAMEATIAPVASAAPVATSTPSAAPAPVVPPAPGASRAEAPAGGRSRSWAVGGAIAAVVLAGVVFVVVSRRDAPSAGSVAVRDSAAVVPEAAATNAPAPATPASSPARAPESRAADGAPTAADSPRAAESVPDRLLREALGARDSGDLERALDSAHRLLVEHPATPAAARAREVFRAAAMDRADRTPGAREKARAYEEVSALYPAADPSALYQAAFWYDSAGDRGRACLLARRLRDRFPGSEEAALSRDICE
jgi:serine/threonine-protein kinase